MPTYEQTPIRLKVALVGNPPVNPLDQNTGLAPQCWRASNIGVAIGIFDAMGNPVDLSNLAPDGQLTLSLFKNQGDAIPLFSKSIAGSALLAMTTAGWGNGTQQQAVFLLTPGDTDQALGGATSAPFWLVLNGVSEAGNLILYAAGLFTIFNAAGQLPPANMPTPSFHEQTNSAGNSTVTPTSNLHTEIITIAGTARNPSNIIIGAAGLAAGARIDVLLDGTAAVSGIILQFYLGSQSGANPFAWSTSGGTKRALFRFVYDGANLQPLEQVNPAY